MSSPLPSPLVILFFLLITIPFFSNQKEFTYTCQEFFRIHNVTNVNCLVNDPLSGRPVYPADSDNHSLDPFYCSRIENEELWDNISYPCPPPFEFNPRVKDSSVDLACQVPCLKQANWSSNLLIRSTTIRHLVGFELDLNGGDCDGHCFPQFF